jgi:hypothetical protein
MKYILALFIFVTACSPGGSTSATGTPHSATISNAVATTTTTPTTTTTTPAATVQPVPARDESYPYYGENGAVITVRCVQTPNAESLTYTVEGSNLGDGTFRFGEDGDNNKIKVANDGSIDLVAPVLSDMSVDTTVVLWVESANYKNKHKFRGCEPF